MKLFLGVDGGQSGTAAVIGDETGRILGAGEAGPCNHAAAGEGRAKLERAVTGSVAAACEQAGLDGSAVWLRSRVFRNERRPRRQARDSRRNASGKHLMVTTDAVIALVRRHAHRAGNYHDRWYGVDRLRTESGGPHIASGRLGTHFWRRRRRFRYRPAGDSGGACASRKVGVHRPRCGRCCWRRRVRRVPTRCCTAFTPTTGRGRASPRWRGWWTPRRWSQTLSLWEFCAARHSTSRCWPERSGRKLWSPGSSIELAYIGGVFQSRILLESFRSLVELQKGVTCNPPRLGPAEGALREAYRSTGIERDVIGR